MQGMMVQVKFFDISGEQFGMRTGELVNPFKIDELGLNIENAEHLDVLVQRSNGDHEVYQINPAQVDEMLPVVRRNGQWVVVQA